jgi:predicted MPP superfamily phosphohydrolase
MPKLLWATDIHLNAANPRVIESFCTSANGEQADALLLGGDIAEAPSLKRWLLFLAERIHLPIFFVLGNHDYYASDVKSVREQMQRLEDDRLKWLPESGVAHLGDGIALVGHGGWGDARFGNFDRSNVILTDYIAIQDLAEKFDHSTFHGDFRNQHALKEALQRFGDDAAASLRQALEEAVATSRQLIVLTHVPPFREACWYEGRYSDDHWMPAFTCKAVGDVILEVAKANQGCNITVLCGHTHGQGVADILPNLRTYTGEAEYGRVDFRVVSIDRAGVSVT